MNSQIQTPSMPDNMRAIARRVGTSMLARRAIATATAAWREMTELVNAAGNMRNELRRMADENESINPEHAAQLRKLANSNWHD